MARYGEGDKRWIVEDRADGTNVHNWHWAETNCLEWSKALFTTLLADLTLLDGEANLFAKTTSLRSLDGEAYVNVRKGKIIPGYELSLSLAWHGEAKDSHGASLLKVDGTVDIPYISDENADEDPEVKVTVNDQGPIGNRIRDAVISKGKPLILDKVRVWVQAMARGGPVKDELDTKKVAPPPPSSSSAAATKATPSAAAPPAAKKEAKKEETKKGRKSISMTEKFNCRAKDLFEILMDENRWKGFTQSNARISKEVGGEFTIFDGSVTGTNLELQEGKLIVQRWRFGSWNDGVQSTVRLVFDEPEAGVTVVKLTHTDVPEEDRYGNATVVENTERGWRDLIFQRIRAVFGFGI